MLDRIARAFWKLLSCKAPFLHGIPWVDEVKRRLNVRRRMGLL